MSDCDPMDCSLSPSSIHRIFQPRELEWVAFCHKGGVSCISEVIDISPCNLDSSLCFFQPSISHDVLLIAKFRLKWKKVGEITRPFRYDLNQIPYDYTVEVRNRLKVLDLIDRVPKELQTEVHDIVQEAVIKIIPKKKKCKKEK